jgi:hypothetical protein
MLSPGAQNPNHSPLTLLHVVDIRVDILDEMADGQSGDSLVGQGGKRFRLADRRTSPREHELREASQYILRQGLNRLLEPGRTRTRVSNWRNDGVKA